MTPELEACLQPDGPLRPTFCNIPMWGQLFVYVAGLLAMAMFAWGVYRHWRVWMAGQPNAPARNTGNWGARLGLLARYVLGQRKVIERRYPGVFHTGIFWGFAILLVGTILATVDWDVWHLLLGKRFLGGTFYLGYEAVLDAFGLLVIIGLVMAMWRRYVMRPVHVLGMWDFVLWSLLVSNVTGFLVEGLRLVLGPVDWADASWAGQALAGVFTSAGITVAAASTAHLWLWMLHATASLLFIAAIPFTNAMHLVSSTVNTVLRSTEPIPPGAALVPIDIETAEFFGVSKLSELTWKQRLGVDSCTRCGRCETVCPAHLSGSPLNPKNVIVKLSGALRDELDLPGPLAALAGTNGDGVGEVVVGEGALVEPGELWACTTCLACVEACPVFIEIVDDVVDLRRYLTLTEGAPPGTAGTTLRNMGAAGNPWGYPQEERANWAEGLDVPRFKPGEHHDVLYWVGCSASYDQRNQKIARAVVAILTAAGVDFAISEAERCNCESARRLGDEYLYQTATEENVASLNELSFDRVVCHCPHCFNTLKNEYPDFGGEYEVVHHSQLIRELVADGRLPGAADLDMRVAVHDSCYLGRYNNEFEAPRDALRAAGAEVVELPRSGADGLCCGGGGGKMWFDPSGDKNVEIIRLEEALDAKPDVVGVACPFCLSMLDSAKSTLGVEGVEILDVAEVLARALDGAGDGGHGGKGDESARLGS